MLAKCTKTTNTRPFPRLKRANTFWFYFMLISKPQGMLYRYLGPLWTVKGNLTLIMLSKALRRNPSQSPTGARIFHRSLKCMAMAQMVMVAGNTQALSVSRGRREVAAYHRCMLSHGSTWDWKWGSPITTSTWKPQTSITADDMYTATVLPHSWCHVNSHSPTSQLMTCTQPQSYLTVDNMYTASPVSQLMTCTQPQSYLTADDMYTATVLPHSWWHVHSHSPTSQLTTCTQPVQSHSWLHVHSQSSLTADDMYTATVLPHSWWHVQSPLPQQYSIHNINTSLQQCLRLMRFPNTPASSNPASQLMTSIRFPLPPFGACLKKRKTRFRFLVQLKWF